jgi:cellulose synthase/poly-beta-1,6-N-acetylglucosamine synthase-like glycosyltransferase
MYMGGVSGHSSTHGKQILRQLHQASGLDLLGWANLADESFLMSSTLSVVDTLACIGLAGVSVPALVYATELTLGLKTKVAPSPHQGPRPRLAVLVPAHNESMGVVATVKSIRAQLQPGDRLLVVADNCSDDTAAQARSAGADVTIRQQLELRGKGYALDHGVRELASDHPPEVVVMIDADCLLGDGALDALARACAASQAPVQARYLMLAPTAAPLKTRIAAFAWMIKNQVRPQGARALGWPCQLTGSGMTFPWRLISQAPLANGHLVEDMKLGVEMAVAGHAPTPCPEALVTSTFPLNEEGLASQRTRWETGHFSIIRDFGPQVFREAVRQRSWRLLGMALDVSVPPLVSLILASLVALLMASAWSLFTWRTSPMLFACVPLLLIVLSTMAAWWQVGRHHFGALELLSVPAYIFGKIPLYMSALAKKPTGWIRTRRDHGSH